MITLSMFREVLNSTEPLSPLSNRSVNGQERYLLKTLTTLPTQTQEQQIEHLESVLRVLHEANIDNQQRLELMTAVVDASDRLIATLRQHYIYETGALDQTQMLCVAQIQSLHYLIIMVYDKVIRFETQLSEDPSNHSSGKRWQRFFGAETKLDSTLAIAIYQSLLRYQKLLAEETLCYRKPSDYLWSRVNQLYYLAYERKVADIELSLHTVTHQTNSIHQLYCQICLHDLLNLRAMRRPNILLVQRLLPEWARHVVATMEPTTDTKVFVDLHSSHPPSYLTVNSYINPYEDRHNCLFIELTPMVRHFDSRKKVLFKEGNTIEYSLLNTISMTISYRYLQQPLTLPTQYSSEKPEKLITNFNNIHYYVSHSKTFANLIDVKYLREEDRPLYETFDNDRGRSSAINIKVFDDKDSFLAYRTLYLLPKDSGLKKSVADKNILNKEEDSVEEINPDVSTTAPQPLHIMGLILVSRSDRTQQPNWSIGVVRWLNVDNKNPEVEWQVLGHKIVACGLRLEGSQKRSRHFVPAFILGKDEKLKTTGTLIVPPSYFQVDDRVVMRIGNKQTSLRLGRRLIMTDEFSQYEIAQL